MLENVKGYTKLTELHQELFKRVHKRHMDACGEESKKKYTPKSVRWDNAQHCLIVRFKGSEWLYYYANGTWG